MEAMRPISEDTMSIDEFIHRKLPHMALSTLENLSPFPSLLQGIPPQPPEVRLHQLLQYNVRSGERVAGLPPGLCLEETQIWEWHCPAD